MLFTVLIAALLQAAAAQGAARPQALPQRDAAAIVGLLRDFQSATHRTEAVKTSHRLRTLLDLGHGPQPTFAGISKGVEDPGQAGRRLLDNAQDLTHAGHLAAKSRSLQQQVQVATPGPRCYLGCFADTYNHRALSRFLYLNDKNMTIDDCQVAAQRRNYTLFSLQNARECWAGKSLNRATLHGSDALCNQTCTGNSNETCGGWLAFNLYGIGDCPGSFTSDVAVFPTGNVTLGNEVMISVNITAGAIIIPDAIVDVEVFDVHGNRVFQKFASNQNFTWGQRRSYDFFWTPSAIPEGTYSVRVGVFTGNWALLHWHDTAASVPVKAACQFRAQYNMFWNGGEWQTTFMSIYLKNWLPDPIANPWNFTMYNPTYSGQFLVWNLQPADYSVVGHTYYGQSAPWQGDLPANGVEVPFRNFNVISSTSLDFMPTIFTINGRECSISRTYTP